MTGTHIGPLGDVTRASFTEFVVRHLLTESGLYILWQKGIHTMFAYGRNGTLDVRLVAVDEVNQDFVARVRRVGVIPVVTVNDPAFAVDLVGAIAEGGLSVVEITLRSSAGLAAIAACRHLNVEVGAGTVTSAETAAAAVEAGATFVVSPGLDPDTVKFCREAGVPIIPGVATPSEVMAARALGVNTVKLFPVAHLGGPSYVQALSAVWPDLAFVPTGGVRQSDAADYLALPSVVAVGGSWIAPSALQASQDWGAVCELSRAAAALCSGGGSC